MSRDKVCQGTSSVGDTEDAVVDELLKHQISFKLLCFPATVLSSPT